MIIPAAQVYSIVRDYFMIVNGLDYFADVNQFIVSFLGINEAGPRRLI